VSHRVDQLQYFRRHPHPPGRSLQRGQLARLE
jgi:hypothetical protein